MNKSNFVNIINNFVSVLKVKECIIKGCSSNQISNIESIYGILPEYYKIYMSLLGVSSGDFKKGTDILYDELDDINECTVELMSENGVEVPEGMFAFLLHQGYSSLFFLERDDNPRVYCYTEGEEIKKTEYLFSDYILSEIELYNKYQK